MIVPSVSAMNFVSVTPSMDILFPLLRRIKVSTLWSLFLSFMCFANCILGILSFWANIHLSVSAYLMTSFVFGLVHSRRYPPDTSICICQALAEPLRRQIYQAPVSKLLLASTIVCGFGDCLWDGFPGGAFS